MILTNPIIYRGHAVTYDQLKHHSMLPLDVDCDICHKIFKSTKYQLERNGHQLCQSCVIRSKLEKPLPVGYTCGRLTVVGVAQKGGYSTCRCECGTVRDFDNTVLRSKHTLSCGCLQKECARENISRFSFFKRKTS